MMSPYRTILLGLAVGAIVGAYITEECPPVKDAVTKTKAAVCQKIENMKNKATN